MLVIDRTINKIIIYYFYNVLIILNMPAVKKIGRHYALCTNSLHNPSNNEMRRLSHDHNNVCSEMSSCKAVQAEAAERTCDVREHAEAQDNAADRRLSTEQITLLCNPV